MAAPKLRAWLDQVEAPRIGAGGEDEHVLWDYAAAAAHEVGTGLVDCHHDIGLSLSLPLKREQDTVDQAASLEHHLEQLRRRIVEVEDQRGTAAGE